MDNIQIAKKIKQLCKSKNITVKTLLDDCNIGRGFIYNLEKRQQIPLADKLEVIADYLDVSIDYLVGRTDNPQITTPVDNSNKDISQSLTQESKDIAKTQEEAEILQVYRLLDVRDRTKLMSFVFELENNIKQKV